VLAFPPRGARGSEPPARLCRQVPSVYALMWRQLREFRSVERYVNLERLRVAADALAQHPAVARDFCIRLLQRKSEDRSMGNGRCRCLEFSKRRAGLPICISVLWRLPDSVALRRM
jgi:hypothetical protein